MPPTSVATTAPATAIPSPTTAPGVPLTFALVGSVVDVDRLRADAEALANRNGLALLDVRIPSPGQVQFVFDREPSEKVRSDLTDLLSRPFTPSRSATAAPPAINAEAETAARRILPSIVMITEPRSAGARGAGFFISTDGYVLTNAHVARDLKGTPLIVTYDGRRIDARVVGLVESGKPDVAVLKVDLAGAPAVELGDSDQVQRGQTLLKVGHAAGYGNWLVTGGKAISLPRENSGRYLLADMPGAPGDSGGALFDVRGRVVGLVFGGSAPSPGGFDPAPFGIVWSWTAFQDLRPPDATTAAPINDVRAKAAEIIARQANVP